MAASRKWVCEAAQILVEDLGDEESRRLVKKLQLAEPSYQNASLKKTLAELLEALN
jgi:hypothetical protein